MKKWIRFVALLAAVTLLAGCNLVGIDTQLDAQQTVAQVGDKKITKAEWQQTRDDMVSYYQYMYSMYGMTFSADSSTLASLGEEALDSMIEQEVILQKAAALGLDTFDEEETAEIEQQVNDAMEQQRLYYELIYFYDADPDSATLSEAVDARLEEDGYTIESMTESLKTQMIYARMREEAVKDVDVSEEEIKADYDQKVESQKTSYDATPTLYASAVNNGTDIYYVPEGYRGIKHVLIKLDSDKQSEISTLSSTLTSNASSRTSLEKQLAELTTEPEEGEELTEEEKAANEESIAAINEQLAQLDISDEETSEQLAALKEEAYGEILPKAEMVLALAKGDLDTAKALYAQMNPAQEEATPDEATVAASAEPVDEVTPGEAATPDEAAVAASAEPVDEVTPGEAATPDEAVEASTEAIDEDTSLDVSALTEPVDFDTLMVEYGEDPGMNSEPQKTTGYALCEGLTIYETAFQEAAMALENVGDVSDLVEGTNGYHILYYAGDIPAGAVDYDSVKEDIKADLLSSKQDEAYDAAVETWINEAKVKKYPKAMEDVQ